MKAAAAVAVALLLLGAGAAEAWYPKRKLPKPIDSPVIRPKVKEGHKPGNKAKHPPGPLSSLAAPQTARA